MENSSSIIFKKDCPTLVETFLLYGGLYHIIFLLRFRVFLLFVRFRGCLNCIACGYNHFCQGLADMTGRLVRMNLDQRIYRLVVC